MLKIHIRDSTGQMEWALMSKNNPRKVLRWFGKSRPSPEQVMKEEKRVEKYANIKKD